MAGREPVIARDVGNRVARVWAAQVRVRGRCGLSERKPGPGPGRRSLLPPGWAYSSTGQPRQALDSYERARYLCRRVGDRAGEAATLNNIGLVYDNLRNRQQALAYSSRPCARVQSGGPMRRTLTDDGASSEFEEQFRTIQRSAWRWEQQPVYEIFDEDVQVDAFLAGNPLDPMQDRYIGPWLRQVAALSVAGRTIARVRVFEEPPTDYQRWEQWIGRWNAEAGEVIEYLTRSQADGLGPPPFAPKSDWWLFDEERLMIMSFDDQGVRIGVDLLVEEPEIELANQWRKKVIIAVRRG